MPFYIKKLIIITILPIIILVTKLAISNSFIRRIYALCSETTRNPSEIARNTGISKKISVEVHLVFIPSKRWLKWEGERWEENTDLVEYSVLALWLYWLVLCCVVYCECIDKKIRLLALRCRMGGMHGHGRWLFMALLSWPLALTVYSMLCIVNTCGCEAMRGE